MPITETIVAATLEAIFGYLADRIDPIDVVRARLDRDRVKLAYGRALTRSMILFKEEYPQWEASLFDLSFLQIEAAPILAQFLLRNGNPDPKELAECWADSLGVHGAQSRSGTMAPLQEASIFFLESLADILKSEPDLREIHDSRAIEHLVEHIAAIRAKLGASHATPTTRRRYLDWLVGRTYYVDSRGILPFQLRAQIKLGSVFVPLMVEYHTTGSQSMDALQAITMHEQVVITGSPGGGKSTLLQYLALSNAESILSGHRSSTMQSSLDNACFPILIRIADYIEMRATKAVPLSQFLVDYCLVHECPRDGLEDLFTTELDRGNCLVMIDGLDMIIGQDDRVQAANHIDDLVRRFGKTNRIVVTSRSASYWETPLGPPFVHIALKDMDDRQIKAFLERWCSAIEDAHKPVQPSNEHVLSAERQIEGILRTIQDVPGVRRLAVNPLMLRTMVLMHRSDARLLPQRRIELYKWAADILAEKWRASQGLLKRTSVHDRYLTPMLAKLAYWLHSNRPTGTATADDVHRILGQEWARIMGLDWDANDPDPKIMVEVEAFLKVVQEQTGLLVEQPKRRFGFLHETFEEYYASRYLITRHQDAPRLIRRHLHDHRWREPILLALGFKGIEYPEEAAELIETAIFAQTPEAHSLGLAQSVYEELLGRDYRFALRCLSNQVPVTTARTQVLVQRLLDEWLNESGLMRYSRYRPAIEEELRDLADSDVAEQLVTTFRGELHNSDRLVRWRAISALAKLDRVSVDIAGDLCSMVSTEEDENTRLTAVRALGELGTANEETIATLISVLNDNDQEIVSAAVFSLGNLSHISSAVQERLIRFAQQCSSHVLLDNVIWALGFGPAVKEVVDFLLDTVSMGNIAGYVRAIWCFGKLRCEDPKVIRSLLDALDVADVDIRITAVNSLLRIGYSDDRVIERIIRSLEEDESRVVRADAANALAVLGRKGNALVIAALEKARQDPDAFVRDTATRSLKAVKGAHPTWLSELIKDDSMQSRELTQKREEFEQLYSDSAIIRQIMFEEDDPYIRYWAIERLIAEGELSNEIIESLIEISPNLHFIHRSRALRLLGHLGPSDEEVVGVLLEAFLDEDGMVRVSAVKAIIELGQRYPEKQEHLCTRLTQVIPDPEYELRDADTGRPAFDYAHEALWTLVRT